MIRTPKYTLIFLNTQPIAFCTKSKALVAGPFTPDINCFIATNETTHRYLEIPKLELDSESLSAVSSIVTQVINSSSIPVFICDKMQGDALAVLYPSAIIIYPATTINTGSSKAAPGIFTNNNLNDVDAKEILSAIGY